MQTQPSHIGPFGKADFIQYPTLLTPRSHSSPAMVVKPLPCCTMLSIFSGSTLQELSHLCTTLHFAMYICSFCLLYVRVARQNAGPVWKPLCPCCRLSQALVAPEMFPAQSLDGTRTMEITPIWNKPLLGSNFPSC